MTTPTFSKSNPEALLLRQRFVRELSALREHCVKQSLNGNQVARIHLAEPANRVEIRSAMLGNWDPAEDRSDDMIRNFRGRIDDFAISRKALSGDEIKRLFDEGRN